MLEDSEESRSQPKQWIVGVTLLSLVRLEWREEEETVSRNEPGRSAVSGKLSPAPVVTGASSAQTSSWDVKGKIHGQDHMR